MDKKFYVYVHKIASGPNEGKVFYVGKGSGRRAGRTSGRSLWWKRTSDKYGFTHHIIAHFHNEECAFSFERALIAFYGRENLCNMADGGEGASGAKRSPEHLAKMIASIKGIPKTEEMKCRLRAASIASRSDPKVIERISAGTRKAMARPDVRMKIIENHPDFNGSRNPRFNHTKFRFFKEDGSEFFGVQYDFYKKLGLPQSSVNALVAGKLKSYKGWRVDKAWRG